MCDVVTSVQYCSPLNQINTKFILYDLTGMKHIYLFSTSLFVSSLWSHNHSNRLDYCSSYYSKACELPTQIKPNSISWRENTVNDPESSYTH